MPVNRVAALAEVGEPLEVLECPEFAPGEDAAVVGVLHGGICETELHLLDGRLPDRMTALIAQYPLEDVNGAQADVRCAVTLKPGLMPALRTVLAAVALRPADMNGDDRP